MARVWRTLLAAAALAAALAAPAAAQPTKLPFGRIDCLRPALALVDAFPLNTGSHQITRLPSVATKAATASIEGGAAPQSAEEASFFDDDASPLTVTPPYWMKPRDDGKVNPAPKKFDRVAKAESLKAAERVTTEVASMAAAQRSDFSTLARAAAAGQSVTPQMVVAPSTVTVGDLFSITYYGTWKVVTNLVSSEVYVLYQCGSPNPVTAGVSVPAGAKVFEIPLRSAAAPDTMALAFLSNMKLQDRVVAAPSFCADSCGQYLSVSCGYKADPDWATGKLPAELRAASDAIFNAFPDPSDPLAITISAPATDPIIRPQWLKFVGAFYNRDGLGSANADTQARNYDRKRSKTAVITANLYKPRVLWMSSMDTYPAWGYPEQGKQFVISAAKYKRTYIENAGGVMLTGHQLLNSFPSVAAKELYSVDGPYMEVAINPMRDPATARQALLSMLRQADIIIDETYFVRPVNAPDLGSLLTRYDLNWNDVSNLNAYKYRNVYTPGKLLSRDKLGTDWYEGATVETDRVLDDFILAITPQAADPALNFKWLHRLDDGPGAIVSINPRSCAAIKTCTNRRPSSTCPNVFWSCADGTMVYGYRNYHCKPDTCVEVACWCCAANIPAECRQTCSTANKSNCPR